MPTNISGSGFMTFIQEALQDWPPLLQQKRPENVKSAARWKKEILFCLHLFENVTEPCAECSLEEP